MRTQADFEISVITAMARRVPLVVADFVNWAKEHGIRVGPGRALARLDRRVRDADHRS